MGTYIARRLLLMIPTLIGITFLVFMIVALAPGGIGAALNAQGGTMQSQSGVAVMQAYLEDRYGLDDPAPVQYLRWFGRISPIKIGTRNQIDRSGNVVRSPKENKPPPLWSWYAASLPQPPPAPIVTEPPESEALQARFRAAERRNAEARQDLIRASTVLRQSLGTYAKAKSIAGGSDEEGRAVISVLEPLQPDKNHPLWPQIQREGTAAINALEAANLARAELEAVFAARPFRQAGISIIPGVLSLAAPDLGVAYSRNRPVIDLIAKALPVTLLINLIAFPIIYLIAIPGGMLAATYRGSKLDNGLGILFIALYSIPVVLAGVFCVGFLASREYLGWFPVSGIGDNDSDKFRFLPGVGASGAFERGYVVDALHHVALPVLCLVYGGFAVLSKQCRAAMLDNFNADYVRTAKAKGVAHKDVVFRHVFRNSLLPLITMFVSIFPAMLGGSVVIERIFTVPGMGSLIIEAISLRDRELLLANTLMIAAVNLVALLLADILYALADPRVSYN